MARFCSLFSGSSGNCTYIGTGNGGILIDAGVSATRIRKALAARDIDEKSIQAIFITHEHSDHTAGVRVLAKSLGCDVIASRGTLCGMQAGGALPEKGHIEVLPPNGGPRAVADMAVTAFSTPHDTPESTGYIVQTGDGRRIAIATDMGVMTEQVYRLLCGCDVVLLESNYDEQMLLNGPYPAFLKHRILSNRGHLSNIDCAKTLPSLVQNGVSHILLGHLSRHNNLPSIVQQTAGDALAAAGIQTGRDCRLYIAAPESSEPVLFV